MEKIALVSLYHPTGAKVSSPMEVCIEITPDNCHLLIRSVDNLLMAGFTVNLSGLEDSEQYEQICCVVRREKVNNDDTSTPIVDLYSQSGAFRLPGIYLNNPEDVLAFETACGTRLNSFPLL